MHWFPRKIMKFDPNNSLMKNDPLIFYLWKSWLRIGYRWRLHFIKFIKSSWWYIPHPLKIKFFPFGKWNWFRRDDEECKNSNRKRSERDVSSRKSLCFPTRNERLTSVYNARFTRTYPKLSSSFSIHSGRRLDQLAMLPFFSIGRHWDLTNLEGILTEQCCFDRSVRCISVSISCWSRATTERPVLFYDEIHVNPRRIWDAQRSQECFVFRRCHLRDEKNKMRLPDPPSNIHRQLSSSFRPRRRSCPIGKIISIVEVSSS